MANSRITVLLLSLGLVVTMSLGHSQTTGDKSKDKRAASSDYVIALRDFKEEQLNEDGIEITIKVIPDECLFEVAKRYEDCVRRGLAAGEIEKSLKQTLSEHKSNQGRPIFRLKLDITSGKDHFFLEKELKSHIGVTRKADMSVKITEQKGLSASKWWIKETNTAKDFRPNLGYFRTLEFEMRPVGKTERGQTDPFTVKIKGFLRYREVQKRNEYDRMGINVGSRQLTIADMGELNYPELSKSFYPAEWKLPEMPQELKEILTLIEIK